MDKIKTLIILNSLQKRLIVLLIIPVALVLLSAGILGFFYVKGSMLQAWRTTAMLRLEKAANLIDKQLSRPIGWIEMFHNTSGSRGEYAVQEWILQRLNEMEGVTKVNLKWVDKGFEDTPAPIMQGRGFSMGRRGPMIFHRAGISEVTSPKFDAKIGKETFSIISNFRDEEGKIVGKLEVVMSFDYLIREIKSLKWWRSDIVGGLMDDSGKILARTKAMRKGATKLGETNDPLELAVFEAMKKKPFGTIFGPGRPPEKVAGFYKISYAPWAFVAVASRKKALSPIIEFRNYYALVGSLSIILILVLIRFVGGGMIRGMKEISKSAEQIAQGNYGEPLPVRCCDEIGQLTQSFNTMIKGLKERDFISNTFGKYVDQTIAKELMKQPEAARLGGDRRKVTIFMSDIRNFTSLSESLNPEQIISILNRYFSHLIEIIQRHGGIIVDFFGDGILAFFDPLKDPVEPKVYQALHCALEIQTKMEDFNAEVKKEGLPELQTGIGINAGDVVVGNIGSETRAKYGIVGSAVNVTARIQSEAKGGDIVITESVYRYIYKEAKIKHSFRTHEKGLKEEIKLYVVEGLKSQS